MGGSAASVKLAEARPVWLFADFNGTPRQGIWYPSALADISSGSDLKPGYPDIAVSFNADLDKDSIRGAGWYYDQLVVGGSAIDFQTVAMHEIAHGLGIFSSFRQDGSWGYYGIGTIFDAFLVDANDLRLLDKPISPVNVTSGVFWNGPEAVEAYHDAGGTGNVPIYAPSVWRAGSSMSHLDEATFTGATDLMTPYYDQPIREIDPVTLGIMSDMGWEVDESSPSTPEPGTVVLLLAGFTLTILRRRHLSA